MKEVTLSCTSKNVTEKVKLNTYHPAWLLAFIFGVLKKNDNPGLGNTISQIDPGFCERNCKTGCSISRMVQGNLTTKKFLSNLRKEVSVRMKAKDGDYN